MSLAVTTRTAITMPRKKRSMSLFYHLLSDMRHQRIAVITLSVGQAVSFCKFIFIVFFLYSVQIDHFISALHQALAHFALFIVCLGLIHAKQISRILLIDRLDQKGREEFYETPKQHGVSANDMHFMEADKLVKYRLVILYGATALAATYAICTLGLLIGVIKRRCELILPWMIFQSVVCGLFSMMLFAAYAFPNEFFFSSMGNVYYCRCEYLKKNYILLLRINEI